MKIVGPALLGLSLAAIGSSFAAAQDASTSSPVPKVLAITIEYPKPYKGGAAHDKTESAFVLAASQGEIPRLLRCHEFHVW